MDMITKIINSITKGQLIDDVYKYANANRKTLIDNTLGIVGMVFIQGASVPTIVKLLTGQQVSLPELSLVAMVWTGLILYLIRSLRNFKYEWVYTMGNCCGLVFNGIMIYFIIL